MTTFCYSKQKIAPLVYFFLFILAKSGHSAIIFLILTKNSPASYSSLSLCKYKRGAKYEIFNIPEQDT